MRRLAVTVVVFLTGCGVLAPGAGAQIITPPANDDSADAQTIAIGSTATQNTAGATFESGEPLVTDPKCDPATGQPANGGSGTDATVWYRVTGNGKRLSVDTFGSVDTAHANTTPGYDTVLAIYKGTAPSTAAGTFVACRDDTPNGPTRSTVHSRVRFQSEAGQTYLIQAGSFSAAGQNPDRGTIHVSVFEQPANDDRANAETLGPGSYNRSNRGAGPEIAAGEPLSCTSTNYSSTVWFRYSPPSAGRAHFSAAGTQRPVLAVYDAAAPTTQLACNAATASPGAAALDRDLQAGHQYLIQVGGKDTSTQISEIDPLEGDLTYALTFEPDSDGDGTLDDSDADDDNDGVPDAADAFPLDPSESADLDRDGIGDNADTDDDGDGVADAQDAFPRDSSESGDFDGDGRGDNADPDDDNDGVLDAEDAFPRDRTDSRDADRDGIGDNADPDDDNDGVADSADRFPLDPSESRDSDGDSQGDRADPDDDNDNLSDADEQKAGSDPLDVDSDDDGLSDGSERRGTSPVKPDSDKDKLPDGLELGVARGIAAPSALVKGTDPAKFKPDKDPKTRTNAAKADTDRDGLKDGAEDRNHNGKRDRRETDPRKKDTDRDGLIDGRDRRPLGR